MSLAKGFRGALAGMIATVAWSGPAAADLYTPPFSAAEGEVQVCQVANIGSKPLSLIVEVREGDGDVAESLELMLAPGTVNGVGLEGDASVHYCAFRGRVSAKTARATANVVDIGTGRTHFVVPAQ